MIIAGVGQYFFGITIFVFSMFLIMLVLVQRGRGGGLAGALGGPGGQSAFGTKAGDLFTRITIVVATVWIFLCASAVFFLKTKKFAPTGGSSSTSSIEGIGDSSLPAATGGTTSDAATSGLQLDLTPPSAAEGTAEIDSMLSMPELPSAPSAETPTSETPAAPATETPAADAPTVETPAAEPSESTPDLKLGSPDTPAN